jgi:hypothetical protein
VTDLPSNGFIKASELTVAIPPATAVPATPLHPSPLPPDISLTNSYIPKCAACAGPAPNITEATPLHKDLSPAPSVDVICRRCWVIVVGGREVVENDALGVGEGEGLRELDGEVDVAVAVAVARSWVGERDGRTCIRVLDYIRLRS